MSSNTIIQDNTFQIRFEIVRMAYKNIILKWFQENYVKAFYYGDGLKNTLRNLELSCQGINNNGRYTFYHWLAFYNDIPFAFMMTSPIDGPYDENDDYNKWYVDNKKGFTLDLLIGEKDFLGKGLAHILIQRFILDQYSDADYFLIDPEIENSKAIHVYEKVGFKKMEMFCPAFNPKPHVMMHLKVDALRSSL